MPNTKITLQKWKDHYSYAKKVYIIGALIAAGVASLIFSVTRYVAPDERAVIIQMVDTYADTTVKVCGWVRTLRDSKAFGFMQKRTHCTIILIQMIRVANCLVRSRPSNFLHLHRN